MKTPTIDPHYTQALATEILTHVVTTYPTCDGDALVAALRVAAESLYHTLQANLLRQNMQRYMK